MKARMRYRLLERDFELMPKELTADRAVFLKSIEGKEVDLVFIRGDAFLANDRNWPLPDSLWDRVEEAELNEKEHNG